MPLWVTHKAGVTGTVSTRQLAEAVNQAGGNLQAAHRLMDTCAYIQLDFYHTLKCDVMGFYTQSSLITHKP